MNKFVYFLSLPAIVSLSCKPVTGPFTELQGKLTSTTTTLTSAYFGGTFVGQSDADLSLTLQSDGTLTGTAQIAYSYHGEGTQSAVPGPSRSIR